jgi:NADH-quinone oxidoreductase subunit H
MPEFHFWYTIITILAVMGAVLGTCAYLIYVERKVAAFMQDRLGPNRVGPAGLWQPIADGLKFLFKEDIIPDRVDRLLYLAAPCIAVSTALLAFAVVPFGRTTVPPVPPGLEATEEAQEMYQHELEKYQETYQFVIAPGIDIGILFIFAVTSLTVYAILLSGWSSNNKYSFIGGLRSSAQLVSYEIPMGMSILGVVLMAGSLNLEKIIAHQAEGAWNLWLQPLGFLLFMISAFAECNRLPFDLPEAEQELVGGYHTEYSALKFGLFFIGEYTHMITTSFLMVILFLGGWHFPWIAEAGQDGVIAVIVKLFVFAGKMALFILFYMLVRWTIPRFRFDQLMALAWKVLIPLALVNLVCVMAVEHVIRVNELDSRWVWVLLPLSLAIPVGAGFLAKWPGRLRLASADARTVAHRYVER